jgi:hypothetical protein
MRTLLTLSLTLFLFQSIAQTNYITENEEFIGWQPNVEFTFEDFQADLDSSHLRLCNKYDYSTISNIQIYAYLDVAKKKRQRRRKMEEVYIAPVFCKKCSYAAKEDSIELKQDQIYFMIAEFASRVGRMHFDSLSLKVPNSTGILSISFMTIKNEIRDIQTELNASYGRDLLVDKKPEAYEEWKTRMNELLEQTEKYATTPKECHRIITRQPVVEGYILAPRLIGDLRRRNY